MRQAAVESSGTEGHIAAFLRCFKMSKQHLPLNPKPLNVLKRKRLLLSYSLLCSDNLPAWGPAVAHFRGWCALAAQRDIEKADRSAL
jgi:hypothetical protein